MVIVLVSAWNRGGWAAARSNFSVIARNPVREGGASAGVQQKNRPRTLRCGSICGAISGGILVLGMLFPATAAEGPAGKRRITQQTQEYIRRFRARFVDRDCADLLARKDLDPTQQARDLGVTDHCGILIVSAVEILCDYIAELKGE